MRVEAENPWMCEMREMWEGTPSEALVRKDMNQQNGNGEEYPYGDRRQELVFIGQGLKHEVVQGLLDQCLLTDDEMSQGPDKWQEAMAAEDRFQLALDEDDEEEEGEDDGWVTDEEEQDCDDGEGADEVAMEPEPKKKRKKMKKDE